MKLNLACSTQLIDGYLNVDVWEPPNATPETFLKADLDHTWPWADSSVDEIRAHDAIEHLIDPVRTMNETWRVLVPGGQLDVVVPTTDGRGAWQDPTHVSFWNRNSFLYYTEGDPHRVRFGEAYGVEARFKVLAEGLVVLPGDVWKLQIILEAVKG